MKARLDPGAKLDHYLAKGTAGKHDRFRAWYVFGFRPTLSTEHLERSPGKPNLPTMAVKQHFPRPLCPLVSYAEWSQSVRHGSLSMLGWNFRRS